MWLPKVPLFLWELNILLAHILHLHRHYNRLFFVHFLPKHAFYYIALLCNYSRLYGLFIVYKPYFMYYDFPLSL